MGWVVTVPEIPCGRTEVLDCELQTARMAPADEERLYK